MSASEFYRSNVFIARSPRLNRRVQLVSGQYEAWLFIEFDPQVEWYCERPPLALDLLPHEGQSQPLDFWVVNRKGAQYGVLIYSEVKLKARGRSVDLLERSIECAELQCQLWREEDMRRRSVHLRNLKQLLPLMLMPSIRGDSVGDELLSYLGWAKAACSPVTWADAVRHVGRVPESEAGCHIARLIHSGQVIANLQEQPLSATTVLSLP